MSSVDKFEPVSRNLTPFPVMYTPPGVWNSGPSVHLRVICQRVTCFPCAGSSHVSLAPVLVPLKRFSSSLPRARILVFLHNLKQIPFQFIPN